MDSSTRLVGLKFFSVVHFFGVEEVGVLVERKTQWLMASLRY